MGTEGGCSTGRTGVRGGQRRFRHRPEIESGLAEVTAGCLPEVMSEVTNLGFQIGFPGGVILGLRAHGISPLLAEILYFHSRGVAVGHVEVGLVLEHEVGLAFGGRVTRFLGHHALELQSDAIARMPGQLDCLVWDNAFYWLIWTRKAMRLWAPGLKKRT